MNQTEKAAPVDTSELEAAADGICAEVDRLRAVNADLLAALKQAGILINSAPEIGLGRDTTMAQIRAAISKAEASR